MSVRFPQIALQAACPYADALNETGVGEISTKGYDMAKKKRTTKHGKRTTKRAAAAQAKPRRRLTAAGLKKVSLEALRTELQRREDALVARREELLA